MYRLWVPGGKAVSVALQPTDGDADLALWGPKTLSVLESGQARKRDARGLSERSGTKRERLRVRNTARKGAYFYAETLAVSLAQTTMALPSAITTTRA